MKLWQGLVTQLPGNSQQAQSIKKWILQRYVPQKKHNKATNIFWSIPEISFEERSSGHKASPGQGEEHRRGRILESQKQLDQFAA